MLNFQGTVYIKNGFYLKATILGGSILSVNPGSVLIINQQMIIERYALWSVYEYANIWVETKF